MNQEDIERLVTYYSHLEKSEKEAMKKMKVMSKRGSIFGYMAYERQAGAYKEVKERLENMFPEIDRLRKERNQEAGK